MTFSTSRTGSNLAYITSVFIGTIGTDSIGSLIDDAAKKAGVEDGKSIINVRRSSICWRGRRELITDVRKPRNHGYDKASANRRRAIADYSDHPRKLVTLNQNSNQQAPDATSFFPVGGMPTASSLA